MGAPVGLVLRAGCCAGKTSLGRAAGRVLVPAGMTSAPTGAACRGAVVLVGDGGHWRHGGHIVPRSTCRHEEGIVSNSAGSCVGVSPTDLVVVGMTAGGERASPTRRRLGPPDEEHRLTVPAQERRAPL